MLDISTCHITNDTCNVFLKKYDCPVCAYEFEYGWVIPVCFFGNNEIPTDLKDCFDFASRHECTFIKFDCDGFVYDELLQYDW